MEILAPVIRHLLYPILQYCLDLFLLPIQETEPFFPPVCPHLVDVDPRAEPNDSAPLVPRERVFGASPSAT